MDFSNRLLISISKIRKRKEIPKKSEKNIIIVITDMKKNPCFKGFKMSFRKSENSVYF